jgi:hypothetical protein
VGVSSSHFTQSRVATSEQLINPFLSLIVVSVFFCLLHFYGVEEISDVAFAWFNSKQWLNQLLICCL